MTALEPRRKGPKRTGDRCPSLRRRRWWSLRRRIQCRSFEGHPGRHWAGSWPIGHSPEIEWGEE